MKTSKLHIQIQAEKSDSLVSKDDTIQKYVDGKITRDDLIFSYLLSVLE